MGALEYVRGRTRVFPAADSSAPPEYFYGMAVPTPSNGAADCFEAVGADGKRGGRKPTAGWGNEAATMLADY